MDQKIVIGKIHSVSVRDFVTYNEVKMYAGEYLNLILGPNGSGKSTIVAAIILGMGGSPQLLSRSSNITDYIKNGKESASIQIEVFKNMRRDTITFERHINYDGKSTWKVDGRQYNEKEYIKKVAEFHIQVDNLCQFLPQDRVQDFAKMNPQEILVNTQKSVCDQNVIDMFNNLKELRETQLNSKKSTVEYQEKLKKAEQRYETLQDVVEIIKTRKYLIKQIEMCNIKRKWLECEELKTEIDNIEKDLKQQKILLKRDQDKYEKIKERVKIIMDVVGKIEANKKKEADGMNKSYNELNELKNEIKELLNDRKSAKLDFESKKKDESERESRLENANGILQAYLQDLKDHQEICGTEEEQDKQRQYIRNELEKIRFEKEKLMDRCREINRELDDDYQPKLKFNKKKIEELESIPMRRLNMIKNSFEDVYKSVLWLRQNRHMFEGHIYEPMLLELNVKDAENAKYLENSVNIRDLVAFTCECKSDVDLLIRKLCNEQKLRINVIHSEPADECIYKAEEPISKYRNYGFFSYLIDMVEGPAPILNFLCKANGLHKIMIGTEQVDMHSDELPNHCRLFFGGNYKYSIIVSRYSNQKSSLREFITSKNLFCMNIDVNQLNTLKKELMLLTKKSDALKNQRTDIESDMIRLDEKKKGIMQNKKEFEGKLMQLQQYKNQIKMQIEKINKIKNEALNIQKEEDNLNRLTGEICKKIISLQEEKVKCLESCAKHEQQYEYNCAKLNTLRKVNAGTDQEIENALQAFRNSQEMYETIRNKLEICKKHYSEKLKSVKELCNGKSPTNKDFPYLRQYSKLPNTIEELDENILEIQSRIDCMGTENQNVLKEFEELKVTIQNLKEAIQNATSGENNLENEMKKLHDKWYPEIMRVIEIINENFTKFMSAMNYAGEVQLCRNDERDYNEYGIKIMVQYRNDGRLQVLDRFVQSGGERAVAIAIYTLSLQHITNVPFRCVDEINQGMDTINEKKILNMIIAETSQPNKSQYFFISPKLPTKLTYNDTMVIQVLFSGQFKTTFQPYYDC